MRSRSLLGSICIRLSASGLVCGPSVEALADQPASGKSFLVAEAECAKFVERRRHPVKSRWRRVVEWDIDCSDDLAHPAQHGIAELVLVEQRFERAAAVMMSELGSAHIERNGAKTTHVLSTVDKHKRRVRI